jgi:hypothetical protein
MTIPEAKAIGRTKTIKATLVPIGLFVLLLLIQETEGDFANGILFFFSALFNKYTVLLFLIVLGLTYLFSGNAGKEIILNKKNIVLITLKYATVIAIAVGFYAFVIGLTRERTMTRSDYEMLENDTTALFIKSYISLLLVWFWSTYRMKLAAVKVD